MKAKIFELALTLAIRIIADLTDDGKLNNSTGNNILFEKKNEEENKGITPGSDLTGQLQ